MSAHSGSMAQPPTLRIIVPTHARPDDLSNYLDALLPQIRDRPNVRLTIVNDGTHDAAYQKIISKHRSLFDYIIRDHRGGCGAARRTGAQGIDEDYIVTSDDDCVPPPYWVAQLVALIARHPEVDVISGLRYFVASKTPGIVEQFFAKTHGAFGVARNHYGLIRIATPTAAIKRQAYERAGGFSPEFKTGEDTFLTLKLIETGANFLICDKWLVGHKSGQTLLGEMRRYYHYGFSVPLYLLVSQDWRMDPAGTIGSVGGALRALYHWHLRTWRADGVQILPLVRRLSLLAVGLIIGGALQVGMLRGLRHFRRIHMTDLPLMPPLEQQMSGFVFGGSGRQNENDRHMESQSG